MKNLPRFLRQSVLSLLLLLPLSGLCCFAEVKLTDEEATEMLNEMQESRKELTEAQNQLSEAQNQLSELKVISEEQRKSYEEQLNEAEKKNSVAVTFAGVGGGASIGLLIALILVLCL